MGFIISVLFGRAVQQVFFGRLRAIEVEVYFLKKKDQRVSGNETND